MVYAVICYEVVIAFSMFFAAVDVEGPVLFDVESYSLMCAISL